MAPRFVLPFVALVLLGAAAAEELDVMDDVNGDAGRLLAEYGSGSGSGEGSGEKPAPEPVHDPSPSLPPPPAPPSPSPPPNPSPPLPSTPPPPPSPGKPPGGPGAAIVTQHLAYASMAAQGAVSDFNDNVLDQMSAKVAESVGAPASSVTATVQAGSVVITFRIQTADATAAAAAETSLTTSMGTAAEATTFFSAVTGASIVITAAPTINTAVETLVTYPPPPSPPVPSLPPGVSITVGDPGLDGGEIAGAVLGPVGFVGLVGGFLYWKSQQQGKQGQDVQVQMSAEQENV